MDSPQFAQYAVLGVIGIVTIVAVAAFSKKLGVAAPLILVVLGIGGSYLPGFPADFALPPQIILVGLLPPLLYSAAINVPLVDFRRNLNTISALSVLLVVASAFITGSLLYLIFPDLNFAAAVALGAVISPTDAVAATSLGKRLGLPPRLITILEGESLVNDATALVLLRSAVAAASAIVAGVTTVNIGGVVADFGYAVVVAIVVGLVIGFVTVFLRSKLRDPVLDTAISFAVPFIAFIPAEELGASGVLAVVVAGLYAGHSSARHFTPQARISERLNWRTAQFVVENGVFLLMGLQIRRIVESVDPKLFPAIDSFYVGLLMTAVIIVIRFLFVGPLLLWQQRHTEHKERRNRRFAQAIERVRGRASQDARLERSRQRATRVYNRRATDLTRLREEGFGWRSGVILSWSGMRGVVTLAAAQSLPADGSFPYREQLILVAFTVAITTLLLQGGTLPWLIRASGIRGTDRAADRRELATLLDAMSDAGVAVLESPRLELPGDEVVAPEVIERVRHDTLLGAESAWERAEHGAGADALVNSPHQQYRTLRREVLQAEREALLDARSAGTYASRVLSRAQAMLDLEETRLEQIDNPSGS
ncbi:sodium:proton antiporter [Frigoribacterium sp. UYMn621]|jgi:NhaP-type Na+/H+ or K+/H+ antiporter|uniref:cation:proton antiporter n=1 Tax=Frigoribacterium sp. UYMn621 TaxID=3156343 RepID=UPI003392DB80